MKIQQNNYAFIDAQNLYLAIAEFGWKVDYKKFRVYLKEKYGVQRVYMGFLPTNQELYNFLQTIQSKKEPHKNETLWGRAFHRNYNM